MMCVWCLLALMILMAYFLLRYISIIYTLFFLFCLYRAFLRNLVVARVQYRRLATTYGEENWVRTITFNEDGIELSEGKMTAGYAYSDIVEIREKQNKIWLIAGNKTVIRLYRDTFINTDWETCKDLLQKRAFQKS
ncbi:MAG: hypothetical protein J1E65_03590 [Lachnospiraceae bacterium]|nr:hypothetical protein [Lachnospiraceae bacterium]